MQPIMRPYFTVYVVLQKYTPVIISESLKHLNFYENKFQKGIFSKNKLNLSLE